MKNTVTIDFDKFQDMVMQIGKTEALEKEIKDLKKQLAVEKALQRSYTEKPFRLIRTPAAKSLRKTQTTTPHKKSNSLFER